MRTLMVIALCVTSTWAWCQDTDHSCVSNALSQAEEATGIRLFVEARTDLIAKFNILSDSEQEEICNRTEILEQVFTGYLSAKRDLSMGVEAYRREQDNQTLFHVHDFFFSYVTAQDTHRFQAVLPPRHTSFHAMQFYSNYGLTQTDHSIFIPEQGAVILLPNGSSAEDLSVIFFGRDGLAGIRLTSSSLSDLQQRSIPQTRVLHFRGPTDALRHPRYGLIEVRGITGAEVLLDGREHGLVYNTWYYPAGTVKIDIKPKEDDLQDYSETITLYENQIHLVDIQSHKAKEPGTLDEPEGEEEECEEWWDSLRSFSCLYDWITD